jgi:integrase/recombinase XerD
MASSIVNMIIDHHKGRHLTRQSLYIRIKGLVRKAGITGSVGTHTLRHSIATHLLQSGMALERTQSFLGHLVLDSTQKGVRVKKGLVIIIPSG